MISQVSTTLRFCLTTVPIQRRPSPAPPQTTADSPPPLHPSRPSRTRPPRHRCSPHTFLPPHMFSSNRRFPRPRYYKILSPLTSQHFPYLPQPNCCHPLFPSAALPRHHHLLLLPQPTNAASHDPKPVPPPLLTSRPLQATAVGAPTYPNRYPVPFLPAINFEKCKTRAMPLLATDFISRCSRSQIP